MAEPRNQPAPRQQPAPRNQDAIRGTRAPTQRNPAPGRTTSPEAAAAIERIKDQQRELANAGFSTPIDGVWGPDTQAKWDAYQTSKRENAEREQAALEAKAKTEQQQAAARAAEAAARATEAEAEAKKIAAEASVRKAEQDRQAAAEKAKAEAEASARTERQRAIAMGLGIAGGIGLSVVVDKRKAASVAAKQAELAKAAAAIEKQVRKVERSSGSNKQTQLKILRGQVESAKALGLAKFGGARVSALVAGLLAEGALSYAQAQDTKSEATKELLNALATGSAVAAVTLVSKQSISASLPTKLPDAKASGIIASAEQVAAKRQPKARPGAVGKVLDQILGPPKPTPRQPRVAPAAKAMPAIAHVAPGTTGPTPPPIPPTGPKPPPLPANLPATLPAAKPPVRVTATRALGIVGLIAAATSVALTARSQGAAAAVREAGALLDPTAGAAGRVLDAITGKPEPEAPSLGALAKQQGAERTVSTSPLENLARQAAEAQMPAAQTELAQRFLAAGNGGLENFYEGAQPPEFAERAKYQGMAGQQAAEANAEKERPGPTIADVAGPPPAVAKGGPRGWANPVVQEAAQKARREKGYI